jgi:hypothetical protein
MEYILEDLGGLTLEEALKAMQRISEGTTILIMNDSLLHLKSNDELIIIFQAIPSSVTRLVLRNKSEHNPESRNFNNRFSNYGVVNPLEKTINTFPWLPDNIFELELDCYPTDLQSTCWACRAIPEQVKKLTLRMIPKHSYSPNPIDKPTYSLNLYGGEQEFYIHHNNDYTAAIAKSLPHIFQINIVDKDGVPFKTGMNLRFDFLKYLINNRINNIYNTLIDERGFPKDIALLIIEQTTGVSSKELKEFITQNNEAQESYNFRFQCLWAFAIVSTVILLIGIAAIILGASSTVGGTLIAVGSVGTLLSGYGLFKLEPTDYGIFQESNAPILN